MKYIIITTIFFLFFSSSSMASEEVQGDALFKSGQGLALTEIMAQSIDLQTTEVVEENITPVFFVELQSYNKGKEISGWITSDKAIHIRKGTSTTLNTGTKSFNGKVTEIKKSSYAAGGDYEITVQASEEIKSGTPVNATFVIPVNKGLLVVPKSSLLTTVEGKFVYAKNGDFYVRTPVKTGNVSNDKIEILDGLYSGDEVVTTSVMQLWLAELQAIRGGQSCADGH